VRKKNEAQQFGVGLLELAWRPSGCYCAGRGMLSGITLSFFPAQLDVLRCMHLNDGGIFFEE